MRISAKAPCRVDLAGGTLDIWPLYLYHRNAVTVNFAIDRYQSCVLETRSDSRITVCSRDLRATEEFASLDDLRERKRYRLPLAARVIRYFAPSQGFDLYTDSQTPAGGGIAGSSTLIIALSSALNRLTRANHPPERIREISQNVEAQIINVPTGCQDYYPALYGGIAALELTEAGILRRCLPVDAAELNRRFVLAYTGEPRNSGVNNWEVTKAHIDGDRKVFRNFAQIAHIAHQMRCALERSDWDAAARLLREEWSHRRRNAPGISTPLIDRLVTVTRRAGAVAAKVCGAGGGGCVVFLVEPGAKDAVAAAIERQGAQVLPVRVANRGVRVTVET
jgi:D-glycero-alpha-D-manno-heptose-7-phosphate kinase